MRKLMLRPRLCHHWMICWHPVINRSLFLNDRVAEKATSTQSADCLCCWFDPSTCASPPQPPPCRQPEYVSWFLGGNLLRTYSAGDRTPSGANFIVPNQPQRPVFSIWSDPVGGFGGRLDPSKGPCTANFQQMRQIVCDRPAPSTPLGPSWLYA